ncbi:serine--tRNA ligase [Pseudochrobactrum algeriensis]|uniref:serine--tRNA ligase n=1 Tax=Pseudochrobactrum TaxID=354349 RepID=UPI00039BF05D|nr:MULTISPECIES: serine--tRNA ligase [Pseudochrobactrum]MBX8811910.1 serine--tRNA ligase [Ochrobactrum sp. MR34]QVQ35675.1 serine--tRNA ligase [Pseudochrobactrum algeriensis]QVQ38895.1 serine--tRNA ligase [Pseudochrobactrum algeriensis]QVQ42808.1 serine--tRNA ligase [Pseudochrobactrum algeriensis]
MLDIKWIRENPEALDAALQKRGASAVSSDVLALDEARRQHIAKVQEAQERRNAASKEIGKAMGEKDMATADRLKAEVAELKTFLTEAEEEERRLDKALNDVLSSLPNVPYDSVPVGKDENDNVETRRVGNIRNYGFEPKEHFELGEALGLMDFERATRMSGSRFTVLKGALARLERALGQFMLDLHTTEHGYSETMVPLMVRDDAVYGTGQLPKFSEDLFRTTDGRWLIPTAEVPLTNLVNGEIVDGAELPMRVTALTPCFRSEAGSAGRDTRGMLRQHQFWKVEMVSVTDAESSEAELERMTGCAEEVLKRLGLPFRTVTLCTGDMGFGAQKTYDIEVWLPGQNTFREISSCSVCGDFQGRRMNARYRAAGEKATRFVHTLNGSGVAVGRALIAVMENYQEEDGSITIPEALVPYMGGMTRIEKA